MATILVLEDDTIVMEYITEVLERKGHTVICAENAEEAIDHFSADPESIDLVISDIEIRGGDLDGDDFISQVREQKPDQQVIIVSGGYGEHVARLEKIGNPPFLQKPFPPEQLEDLVSAVV